MVGGFVKNTKLGLLVGVGQREINRGLLSQGSNEVKVTSSFGKDDGGWGEMSLVDDEESPTKPKSFKVPKDMKLDTGKFIATFPDMDSSKDNLKATNPRMGKGLSQSMHTTPFLRPPPGDTKWFSACKALEEPLGSTSCHNIKVATSQQMGSIHAENSALKKENNRLKKRLSRKSVELIKLQKHMQQFQQDDTNPAAMKCQDDHKTTCYKSRLGRKDKLVLMMNGAMKSQEVRIAYLEILCLQNGIEIVEQDKEEERKSEQQKIAREFNEVMSSNDGEKDCDGSSSDESCSSFGEESFANPDDNDVYDQGEYQEKLKEEPSKKRESESEQNNEGEQANEDLKNGSHRVPPRTRASRRSKSPQTRIARSRSPGLLQSTSVHRRSNHTSRRPPQRSRSSEGISEQTTRIPPQRSRSSEGLLQRQRGASVTRKSRLQALRNAAKDDTLIDRHSTGVIRRRQGRRSVSPNLTRNRDKEAVIDSLKKSLGDTIDLEDIFQAAPPRKQGERRSSHISRKR